MIILIAVVVAACFVLYIVTSSLYSRFGYFKRFFHDMLDWHRPDPKMTPYYDSGRIHSRCVYCNEDIVKDSNGNWF